MADELTTLAFESNKSIMNGDNSSLYTTNMVLVDNPEEMLNPLTRNPFLVYIVTGHLLACVFGSIGNIVVISIVIIDQKTHNATTHLFLRSLAVADLVLLVVCTPLEIYRYFALQWDDQGFICKLASFVEFLSASASVLNLVAITVERFIVIVFPLKSRSVCTINNCRKAVLVVWLVACLLTTPVLFTKGTYTMVYYNNVTNIRVDYCNDVDDNFASNFAIYQLILVFAMPATVMIICYSYVIRELWISTKNMQYLTNSGGPRSRKYKESGRLRGKWLRRFKQRTAERKMTEIANPDPSSIANRQTSGKTDLDSIQDADAAYAATAGPSCENVDQSATGLPKTGAKKAEHPPGEMKGAENARSRRCDEVKSARRQVIKMLVLVISVFVVCWGPKIVLLVLLKHRVLGYSTDIYLFRVIVNFLPFVHACINPCIYCIMSKKCHNAVRRQFKRLRCDKGNSSVKKTRSGEDREVGPQVSSHGRHRESSNSVRFFTVHRGSTTTSSTINAIATEVLRQTEVIIESNVHVDKVDIIEINAKHQPCSLSQVDETAL